MRTMNHHLLLIVDDDEDDRYILEHAFQTIHWSAPIHFFDSGESLFRYLDALDDPATYPSLVLLDFSMPRMGTADILGRLKGTGRYSGIKAGVYSTAMDEGLCSRLKTLGAIACYHKSSDVSESIKLATALREEVEREQKAA